MKPITGVQDNEPKVANLYKYLTTSIGVHILIAGFLIYMAWGAINTDYIFHWASLLVCALLISVLSQTMFNRKSARQMQNTNKWEAIYAFTSSVTSMVFATAYCYLILLGDASLLPTVSFIIALHLGCMIIPCLSSVKAMFAVLLPVTLPVIGALVMLSQTLTIVFAAAIGIYTCVILLCGFSVHRMLMLGFDMKSKYKKEVRLTEQYKIKLDSSSIEDPLTQIFNRRFFDLMINEEIRRAKRVGNGLSIALIEIDCFSEYSKNYSQSKADKAICSIAKILSQATSRGGEFLTRFEHDKFALILPNVPTEEAIAFASKMMDLVSHGEIEHRHTRVENLHKISISAGISHFKSGDIIDVEDVIQQAQYALETARHAGRNNCQVFAANLISKGYTNANNVINKPKSPTLVSNESEVA